MSILDAEHDRLTRTYRSDNLRPVGDALDAVEQAAKALQHIHGRDELVEVAPNVVRLHRSIITPEWRTRMLAEAADSSEAG